MLKNDILSNLFTKNGHLKSNIKKYQHILNEIEKFHLGETIKEKIYCIINDISEYKLCSICKTNKCKFINLTHGYAPTCSNIKCINKRKSNSIKNTTLNKYRCR